MYTYSIFSVKPKIAIHYFCKTGILFRFLQEVEEHPNDSLLQLQYEYIINPLSFSNIMSILKRIDNDIEIEKRDQYLKLYWQGKQITIYQDNGHLKISSEDIDDVEEFLFPALRKSPEYYFAINNRLEDYGWLSVKNNRIVDNQILYPLH